jgi:hypothetical protein
MTGVLTPLPDGALGFWQAIEEGLKHKPPRSMRSSTLPLVPCRRTTNVIESSFATVRHRTVRSKGMSLEQNCARHDLQARRGRREKLASPQWYNQLPKVILGVKFTDGIEVVRSQAQADAA